MKVGVGEVNLERGNDLGHKEAEAENGSCLKRFFHANPYLSQRRPPSLRELWRGKQRALRGREDWDTDKHGFIGLKRQTISVDL